MSMTVIYDPQIPGETVRRLAEAAKLGRLVPFSASQKRLDAARHVPSTNRSSFLVLTFVALFFWVMTVVRLASGSIGGGIFLSLFAAGFSFFAVRTWRELQAGGQPTLGLEYRRRYVAPAEDLDQEARKMWSRAAKAAETITRSEVIREQHVDTVRVSAVLPQWLWHIAETLALLTEARAEQRKILPNLNAGDPEVAGALSQQRRVQELAVADAERKIRQLEELADRVAEAASAIQGIKAARDLATLNDSHANLLARVDHSGAAETQEAELLTRDLQIVIAQANEAVRLANEAANSLVLPGE
jgi:hypothetical protein